MRAGLTAAIAAILAAMIPWPALCAAADAQSVDSLLHSAQAALGENAPSNLRSYHYTGSGTIVNLTAQFEGWSDVRRGLYTDRIVAGPLSGKTGWDGHDAWSQDDKGVVITDGGKAGISAAVNESYRERDAMFSAHRGGAQIRPLGRRRISSRLFDVLEITPPSGLPFELWLDAQTHLPARVVETIATITTTSDFSDYRTVLGVKIAFHTHERQSDGNDIVSTLTHVDPNPADIELHLTKPSSSVHDFRIEGDGPARVPFSQGGDSHVYLDVMLNGKGPYHFLFDTGGSNVIDPAVAREIAATPVGSAQGSGVGSGTEEFRFARVGELRVGRAVLDDQLFIVAPVRAGFAAASGASIDGLIGFEVLARFRTTFDYGDGVLLLDLPTHQWVPSSGSVTIPFVFNDKMPQIPCAIDAIATSCTVDTGSGASIDVLAPFVAAHGSVVPPRATNPGVVGFGVGGPAFGRLGRLGSLSIGTFMLSDLIAGFSLQKQGFFASPYIGANLGGGVWKRFTLVLDYPHSRLALVPNAEFARPDIQERAGIIAVNQDGWLTVADVRSPSPASEAGIERGDVILSLDGKTPPDLSLDVLQQAFRRSSGTVVHVGISRNHGPPRDVPLTLRDYV